MEKILKKNNGITLVALVITIIVLIILAGVSINVIFGEDGILNKSKTAVEKYENSSKEEAKKLEEISNLIEGYANGVGGTEEPPVIPVTPIMPVEDLQAGDFVNYSAGTWQAGEITALTNAGLYAGASLPTSSTLFKFGGFKAGDSKDASITTTDGGTSTYSGWRVLKVENGVITIVHAGTPEGYYHPLVTNYAYKSEYILSGGIRQTSYANGSNGRDWSMYEDGNLANPGTAHCMTYDEAYAITGSKSSTENSLRNTGSYYWLATASDDARLRDVLIDGGIHNNSIKCFGLRPVVSLQSNVKVIGGSGTDTDPYILGK